MKIHTTNYLNTFIAVADDCIAKKGEIPPEKKSGKTLANRQFDLIMKHPYQYTSDDVLFQCFAQKSDLKGNLTMARTAFFQKGRPVYDLHRLQSVMDGVFTVMKKEKWRCLAWNLKSMHIFMWING